MSILDRTDNLIDLYVYAQGVSKIPRQYHMWSFISLVAACLQDRVWIAEIADQPLFSNMYIVLWGDSGSGKSVAIRAVYNLALTDQEFGEFINAKHGRATFQAIADMMGRTNRKNEMGLPEYEQPKLWWTMDELANDVGSGGRADDFIKGVTELYYCPPSWSDTTRTYGLVELKRPVFNWLAGSTPEWYMKTVKRDGVEGGFQPRTVTVEGKVEYEAGKRGAWPPVYPKDREEVMGVVRERLRWLCNLPILPDVDPEGKHKDKYSKSGTGKFVLHEYVAAKLSEWDNNRKGPQDGLEAYWNQDGVKTRKLMMVLSAAERSDLLITPAHWTRARKMLQGVEISLPNMLRVNAKGQAVDVLEAMAKYVKRKGLVQHAKLLSHLSGRGARLQDVKSVRIHLYEMGKIEFYYGKDGEELELVDVRNMENIKRGLWYKWKYGEGAVER